MALTMSFEFDLACVFELRTYSKPSRGSLGPETAWPGFKSRLVQYLLTTVTSLCAIRSMRNANIHFYRILSSLMIVIIRRGVRS